VARTRVNSDDVVVDDWTDDVANDCAELLAWLLTGDDVSGQPGLVAGIRAKKERVARWCAWTVPTSARVGA
jgi:hypothetical protein